MGLRWLRQLTEQAREISLRLDADPKTTDLKLELAITPIPKTALADAIAARPANTNAFAGLVTKDSVQWMLLSAPMFHEDLREALVKLTAIGRQAAGMLDFAAPPPETRTVADVGDAFVTAQVFQRLLRRQPKQQAAMRSAAEAPLPRRSRLEHRR